MALQCFQKGLFRFLQDKGLENLLGFCIAFDDKATSVCGHALEIFCGNAHTCIIYIINIIQNGLKINTSVKFLDCSLF